MSSPPTACPSREALAALLADTLGATETTRLEDHLAVCEDCQAAMDQVATGGRTVPDIAAVLEHLHDDPLNQDGAGIDNLYQTARGPNTKAEDWRAVLAPVPDGFPEGVIGMLGRFQVYEHLATGGMGIVFKGFDPATERTVAIKVLTPEWAANDISRRRFLQEAQSVASLDHINVIPIYMVDDEGRYPFLIMPFNEGETLEDRLRREGPLDFDEIRRIGRAIIEGLAAAHEAGIIHRDLKPANILLRREDGLVRISDFGIARAADTPHLTVPGTMPGTPAFMAPEQIDGGELDHRADLFSYGCLLQFMASGSPPFEGDSVSKILHQVTSEPPATIRRPQPLWFQSLLRQLLEKDPCRRPQDAAAVAELLDKRDSDTRPFALMGMAAIVFTSILWILLHRDPSTSSTLTTTPSSNAEQPGKARNVRSGDYHSDLHQAVRLAMAGDTLELSGTFYIVAELVIPADKPLHLEGIKGNAARIVTEHQRVRCLVTDSDSTFRHITFARTAPLTNERLRYPTMVWLREGNEVTIEDCRFQIPWTKTTNPGTYWTGCLAVGRVKTCVLDRCELYGLSAAAINVTTDQLEASTISIRRSTIVGRQGFLRLDGPHGGNDTRLTLNIDQSIIVAALGFAKVDYSKNESYPFSPLHLNVTDSRFEISGALMRFSDTSQNDLTERLQWESKGSSFAFTSLVTSPRAFVSRHEPYRLSDVNEAQSVGLAATDTASMFEPMPCGA